MDGVITCNPFKWPEMGLPGVITSISGVVTTLFITSYTYVTGGATLQVFSSIYIYMLLGK